jgi:hypothetical protein
MSLPAGFAPVYSHNAATGTGAGESIDIGAAVVSGLPPVMIVSFTGTATYTIQGSHDNLNWVDFSASLTAAAAKDLVPGVRYWRTKTTANSAAFTSAVGAFPAANGGFVSPNVATSFTVATP